MDERDRKPYGSAHQGTDLFSLLTVLVLLPFLVQIMWPFLTSFILASILAIVVNPANTW